MSFGFDLNQVSNEVRAELDPLFAAREQGLTDARVLIRLSAKVIRSIHRGKGEEAAETLEQASRLATEMTAMLSEFHELLYSGFYHDSVKEYVEAQVTYGLLVRNHLPLPSELKVKSATYLHGLAEAVGELRRFILDRLRRRDFADIEDTLDKMDDIVDLLAEFDYPDGMTANLRRIADVSRSLTERSRADATSTLSQERLITQLEDAAAE